MSPLQALLHALDRSAIEWENRRITALELPPGPSLDEILVLEGPGIFFSWDKKGKSLTTSPILPGRCATSAEGGSWLALTCPDQSLMIGRLNAPTLSLSDPEWIAEFRPQILDWATTPTPWDPPARWMGTLGKAAQAIHLIVRLRQALAEAVTLKSHQAPRSRHQNLPGELHEWLNAQWPHAPTIEEAAEHFSISRRHFSRALEQTSHFPYSRHLAVSRNLLARDLLIRSSDGIKEIAAACGFAGHEPFIRSFKEWTSWTPLQFRKEWQRRLKKQATLKELCQMGPRQRLAQQSEFPTEALPEPFPSFHTLIVANPHRTPLEVFHHPSPGVRHRMALLSEGQLHFLPSSEAGTIWQIESPHTNGPQFFTMPADHAEIVLETTRSS